jgi:uncharacterized surface protein with fasciclin (FAS1) repeats
MAKLLHITTDHGVSINGAKITKADINCTNGVIHIIDTVLMPKASADETKAAV